MSNLALYDFELSGNCYKVRLLLGMLGLEYQAIRIDPIAGETLTEAFLKINPRGQIPVLRDGDELIWDSMAILVYLARRHGNGDWLPNDPLGAARVMQWLALSENELLYGLARGRSVLKFGKPWDLGQCQTEARAGLATLENRLKDADWLALEHPTIADLACFPYVSLAHEAGIDLIDYPAVRAWLERVRALPGWLAM